MIAMIKHLCLAIVALAAINVAHAGALPSAAPEEGGLSAERLARIGAGMNRGVVGGAVPGAGVRGARAGRRVVRAPVAVKPPALGNWAFGIFRKG